MEEGHSAGLCAIQDANRIQAMLKQCCPAQHCCTCTVYVDNILHEQCMLKWAQCEAMSCWYILQPKQSGQRRRQFNLHQQDHAAMHSQG